MNAINGALNWLFDLVLRPLEAVGMEFALIVVSGVFGILALIVFKHISHQRGIKATKDKIKGHMIEIRLYQDDLVLVGKAIGKVLLRNVQYLTLNFLPFVPLAIPFGFVVAQMVVRYGFDPVETVASTEGRLAGEGTTIRIEVDPARRTEVDDLELVLPAGIVPASKLVPVPARGYAFREVFATAPGDYDLVIRFGGQEHVKTLHVRDDPDRAGSPPVDRPRRFQGERVTGVFSALLWPAERTFPAGSGLRHVQFVYPESELGWLPLSGPTGVILWFLIASMAFGIVMLKPLGVQI